MNVTCTSARRPRRGSDSLVQYVHYEREVALSQFGDVKQPMIKDTMVDAMSLGAALTCGPLGDDLRADLQRKMLLYATCLQ